MKEDLFLMEFNPFLPLQTSENLWFCDAFRQGDIGILGRKGLRQSLFKTFFLLILHLQILKIAAIVASVYTH